MSIKKLSSPRLGSTSHLSGNRSRICCSLTKSTKPPCRPNRCLSLHVQTRLLSHCSHLYTTWFLIYHYSYKHHSKHGLKLAIFFGTRNSEILRYRMDRVTEQNWNGNSAIQFSMFRWKHCVDRHLIPNRIHVIPADIVKVKHTELELRRYVTKRSRRPASESAERSTV